MVKQEKIAFPLEKRIPGVNTLPAFDLPRPRPDMSLFARSSYSYQGNQLVVQVWQ